jgi:hypothetical protein
MDGGTGEILGWVYVTVKILGLAALVIIGGMEAYRYRKRQIDRRNGIQEDESDGDSAVEDDSEKPGVE